MYEITLKTTRIGIGKMNRITRALVTARYSGGWCPFWFGYVKPSHNEVFERPV
jgi:hypothetical protein